MNEKTADRYLKEFEVYYYSIILVVGVFGVLTTRTTGGTTNIYALLMTAPS